MYKDFGKKKGFDILLKWHRLCWIFFVSSLIIFTIIVLIFRNVLKNSFVPIELAAILFISPFLIIFTSFFSNSYFLDSMGEIFSIWN